MTQQTVICMKWGTRYGAEFVNRLASMVARHTIRPTRLVCFTDDGAGIAGAVEVQPLPPIVLPPRVMWKPWRKISLWQRGLGGLAGEVLYLDLDVVVTGPLDEFFDYRPGEYCVARNWTADGLRDGTGNTSVYRFAIGAYHHLYARMMADGEAIVARYPNSQTFVSREIGALTYWPDAWCRSFKHSLIPRFPLNYVRTPPLPAGTRIVAFTGKPDPDEAVVGRWPAPWYKKLYKHVRPTPWIAEHWR